jgi:beta-glucanase (GH16 family)
MITPQSFSQRRNKELKKIDGAWYGPLVTKIEFPDCNHHAWLLAFEDNFDAKSLNLRNWKLPYQGVLAGFDFLTGGSKQWYANSGTTPALSIDSNIQLQNGVLKLIARRESTPIVGTFVTDWSSNPPKAVTDTFAYSSAWIETQEHYGYGRFETRCKIPKGKGLWPAFWMFSGKEGYNLEIDIFEFWNESACLGNYDADRLSKNPHWNIHSNQLMHPNDLTNPSDQYKPCQKWPETGYDDDFHVFDLEWDFYKMVWLIDGVAVRTTYHFLTSKGKPIDCHTKVINRSTIREAYFWPDTESMDVRFNLGVQFGKGKEPLPSDEYPKVFEVDYFRYYKQVPQSDYNRYRK